MGTAGILVVEDDTSIGRVVTATLSSEGHDVTWRTTSREALAATATRPPAVVLLDLGLPDGDGVTLCRDLRHTTPATRIIMVTARADEVDLVVGLDAGADDYMTKPFRLAELLARVRAQLRRVDARPPRYEHHGVVVDCAARRVDIDGIEVRLRPKEFDLLEFLMSEAGSVVTRERIMDTVWDEHWFGSTKTLDMHVLALRRKLAGSALTITTLRHVGYRLEA